MVNASIHCRDVIDRQVSHGVGGGQRLRCTVLHVGVLYARFVAKRALLTSLL